MSNEHPDQPTDNDLTIPSTSRLTIRPGVNTESNAPPLPSANDAPWPLRPLFDDEVDLGAELTARFPSTPLISVARFRKPDAKTRRSVAILSTADATASLRVEADTGTGAVQLGFSYGSMLTLRFVLSELSPLDRSFWLEQMRREKGGVARLWGHARWDNDFVICVVRRHFANIYAFSRFDFDAAVRVTPEVTEQLLDWLEKCWKTADTPPDDAPKLLTW